MAIFCKSHLPVVSGERVQKEIKEKWEKEKRNGGKEKEKKKEEKGKKEKK